MKKLAQEGLKDLFLVAKTPDIMYFFSEPLVMKDPNDENAFIVENNQLYSAENEFQIIKKNALLCKKSIKI